jgi:membrane-bound inhibitor of C-type lysozyme
MPEVTLVDAINLGLARALADDRNVVVSGKMSASTAAYSL